MTSVFEHIRLACARVAQDARHVRLEPSRLGSYADEVLRVIAEPPAYDRDSHYWGAPEDVLAYLVTLDAVNFGSGYFPHLHKLPGASGYHTVALALKARFEATGPLLSAELARFTQADAARLFGQDLDDPDSGALARAELMALFAQALNDLGEFLEAHFGGSFTRFREAAGTSAERLVGLLTAMPLYRDVARYGDLGGGYEVPLLKRAQITASDLALAFGAQGYGRFDDLDALTIFADNLVPHVLREDGLLVYGEGLTRKLDRRELLAPGSSEELELRAVALHAVERLKAELHGRGHPVSSQQLDILLWNRGQAERYRRRARHRCRTAFY